MPVTALPPTVTVPAETRMMPTRLLSSVLLPEPLGPTSDTTSRGSALTVMPRMTGSPPYPAVMPSARSGSPRRVTSADKVGLHNLLPPPQLRHRSLREDGALRHHHHRVAELVHDGQLVLDHEDRHALGAQGDQLIPDPPRQVRVHPGHGLVEQQHPRFRHERAHDLHQPPLAPAQIPRVVVGMGAEPEPLEQPRRSRDGRPLI